MWETEIVGEGREGRTKGNGRVGEGSKGSAADSFTFITEGGTV